MRPYFLVLVFMVLFCGVSWAGDAWSPKVADSKVRINEQIINCDDEANGVFKEVVVLQVVNLTDEKIEVFFEKELWYQDKCTTCDAMGKEHQVQLVLESRAVVSGTCNSSSQLRIFSKMTRFKASELTRYQLNRLSVQSVE